jgi:hypothetical protein
MRIFLVSDGRVVAWRGRPQDTERYVHTPTKVIHAVPRRQTSAVSGVQIPQSCRPY